MSKAEDEAHGMKLWAYRCLSFLQHLQNIVIFHTTMDLADTGAYQWIRGLGNICVLWPLWDCLRLNYKDCLRSPLFPVILTVSSYFFSCLHLFSSATSWEKSGCGSSSLRSSPAGVLQPPHCCTVQVSPYIIMCCLCSQHQWLSEHGDHPWTCQNVLQPS